MKRFISLLLFCAAFWAGQAHAQNNPTTVTVNGYTYNQCAIEHAQCSFTQSRQVLYGAWPPSSPSPMYGLFGPFTSGHFCDNSLGSDPAPGYQKACYYTQDNPQTVVVSGTTYTMCAKEHSNCNFNGTGTIVFGAFPPNDPTATYQVDLNVAGGHICDASLNGTDPAPGYQKACYIVPNNNPFTPPALSNPQNPMSYGAACNGSTDDTAAFQSAANAGDVLVPAGKTCVINGNLWINGSNHHLQCGNGYGMDNTTLKRTVNNNYGMISFGSSSYGNGVHYTGDSVAGCNFIGTNTVAPQFQLGTPQFDIPIETYGMVDGFILEGNNFKQFWGQSMFQTYSSGNAGSGDNIQYNTFQSCGYYGPVFDAHQNGTIQHNTMIDCAAGVENDNSGQTTGGNIIQNNTSTAQSCYGAPDMTSSVMITGGVAGGANYGTNIVRNNTVSGTSNSSCVHGAGVASHIIIGANFSPPHTPAQYSGNTCNNGCTVEP